MTVQRKGDADAQVTLDAMYETAQGVPQDFAEAVRWYRNLLTRETPPPRPASAPCLTLAEECRRTTSQRICGTSRASGAGQKRYAAARDGVAEKMTAQQIAEARRRAREWKPAKVAR